MATRVRPKASAFTQAVVKSMRKLYPESLADKSFDNTGLLLEAPALANRTQRNSVLLTIDLTRAVADEAIERRDSIVVAYHPIIFRGLKSLTTSDTQQESLLRLAAEGISVYSPHTAVDAAPGGLSDWLADIVTDTASPAIERRPSALQSLGSEDESRHPPDSRNGRLEQLQRQYSAPTYPRTTSSADSSSLAVPQSQKGYARETIQPVDPPVEGFENSGAGRLVKFATPQPLIRLIERIAHGMGSPAGFPVAIPQWSSVDQIEIRRVAVCAGSGGSVFKGVDADLYFTGEMSHHDALAATERGACVITLFHSNSERGYLGAVMKPKLEASLKDELADGESFDIDCSEQDRDPYGVVILQESDAPRAAGGNSGEV